MIFNFHLIPYLFPGEQPLHRVCTSVKDIFEQLLEEWLILRDSHPMKFSLTQINYILGFRFEIILIISNFLLGITSFEQVEILLIYLK